MFINSINKIGFNEVFIMKFKGLISTFFTLILFSISVMPSVVLLLVLMFGLMPARAQTKTKSFAVKFSITFNLDFFGPGGEWPADFSYYLLSKR